MKEKKTFWHDDVEKVRKVKYVKLNGKVYPIDDAISLGKITAECLPATKKEYDLFINNK